MNALTDRWAALPSRARTLLIVVGPLAVYLLAYLITGTEDGYVRRNAPPSIVLLGVVYGAVTALGAIGIILIYRANRFINFAHGALGSFVGVLSIGMVIEHGVSYWVMLPVAVVLGALVGSLIEFTVIRRFRNATRLIATVASIGLAQLLGGFELFGSKKIGFLSLTGGFGAPINANFDLPDKVHTFAGDEILIIMVVPAVIAALAWFLLRTDAGVAVRGAAENVDRALLLGIPVRRLSTIVWMLGGSLAALTYMLQAPFNGVKPGVAGNGPTVLLPLLAAAVVARMESLPLAFGAGVGLGIVEQVARFNAQGTPSIVWVIYVVVILVALLLQRGKLSRGEESAGTSWSAMTVIKPIPEELRRLPEVRWAKVAVLGVVGLAFVFIPGMWSAPTQLLACFGIVWAMIGVSLVMLTGWGGNISLGQFGIVGISGMVAANVIADHNADFFAVIGLSAAIGGGVALLVGVPALRVRGLFLAVTTLAFAVALDQHFLSETTFPQFVKLHIDRPLLLERFDLNSNYAMYLTNLAFLGVAILIAMGVRQSRSGRVLIATRDNQRASDAASVPTTNVKLTGFILAGVIAGIAGGLQVLNLRGAAGGSFPAIDSVTVFSTAVIGGLGSIAGAISGVLLFRWLETLTFLGDLRLAINGAGLLVVLYLLPGGLGQLMYAGRDRLLKRVASRREILVPSLLADRREAGEHAADEVGLLQGALSGEPAEPRDRADQTPVGVA